MLYSAVPASLLETELDLCWVRVAGEEPAAYLRKYAGRCRLVHFKDYVGGKQDNMYALIGIEESGKKPDAQAFEYRPLGKGVQNIPLLYKTAAECGAEWIIAEQDEPSMGLSRMECAGVSIKALRAAAE
jgi:sugar phosphate isomerase/epimerase